MEEAQELHRRLLKFNRGETSDESATLDVLRKLETSTITYAILKETKLGHTVGKMRKHANEKLANQAKVLVKSWKNMALSPKPSASASEGGERIPKKSSSVSSTPPASGSSSSSNGTKASPPPPVKPQPQPVVAAPAPRARSKGPFIPPGFDKMRATVRTKLKETLAVSDGGSAEDTAVAIEVAMARMFNMGYPGENKKEYTAKFRQLSFNLKKNAPLREDLLQDAVSAEQLIAMSADELATEEKRLEVQKLRDDAFQKARLDWADANEDKINKQCGIENAKGLFTCGRCKSSKTSNTQKQTRSADEPMTVFVQCHNCGNRWKC
ncbi:hypothetical protein PybrP1_001898 [[Pythium] brassicae (nom. inval.)]|nr:hypothetical protein PybrP1_001898 [[Pythium] brassicae (nom. inval.)]